MHLFVNDLPFNLPTRSDISSKPNWGLPSVIKSPFSDVFNSSWIFCISFSSKSTFSQSASPSPKRNLAQVPEVPIPPHIALHCLLSISPRPEIFTEVSPTFPAKNPSIPYVNTFGFFTFILIVILGVSSFRSEEYGLFPVIALASALNALSLFVLRLSYEFAWIAALLSANATWVPSFGISKIS